MKSGLKRTVVFSVGAAFMPIGVAGLVLPILQGVIILAIGIVLMSISSPRVRSWTEHHTRKYPRVHAFMASLERRIVEVIGE